MTILRPFRREDRRQPQDPPAQPVCCPHGQDAGRAGHDAESSVTLQLATQKGVDLNFSSSELTLSMDDFSSRIIEPAMSVLAANIEADAMSMYKDVGQSIWNGGAALNARQGSRRPQEAARQPCAAQ
jgi:hypothetical protein